MGDEMQGAGDARPLRLHSGPLSLAAFPDCQIPTASIEEKEYQPRNFTAPENPT